MATKNIKLIVEYDGTAYAGWQIQKNERTIQGELTDAVKKITGQHVTLTGASRTDTGVHALGQTCNFPIDHNIEPKQYCPAINHFLPDDIRVLEASEVPTEFNSRYSAQSKQYRYLVSHRRSALFRHRRWETEVELDRELLNKSAQIILGEHDFSSFCVETSLKENNDCRIDSAYWQREGDNLIFEIQGNRFLHNMVRRLVGGMVNLATIGQDNNPRNLTLDQFENIIESVTKQRVPFTAPACGLYLVSVGYDPKEGHCK